LTDERARSRYVAVRVEVDPERCSATGNCTVVAPNVFALDDDADVVRVLVDEVPPADVAAVEDAVRRCPQAALRLLDAVEPRG
jgi:ferredoxin